MMAHRFGDVTKRHLFAEIRSCPLECAGHGLCDNPTGKCFCNLGWTGTGCNNVDESVARKGQVEMEQKEEKSLSEFDSFEHDAAWAQVEYISPT